ncbi:unnamed protein product, partial [Rotaria magnacalcarata]
LNLSSSSVTSTKTSSSDHSQSSLQQGANIVLIELPGSKGTQSSQLSKHYKICRLSTGDLLRQATQDQSSSEGQRIRKAMEAGGLVDDHIVLSLIDKNLTKPECSEQLEQLLASKQKRLHAIPDDLLKRRTLGRLIHKPSSRTYHEEFHPPKESMKDDITGEPLYRRSDDTTEALNARLNTYHKLAIPLIDFYHQRNIHRCVDATKKVNDVYQESLEIVDYLHKQPTYKPASIDQNPVDKNVLSKNYPIYL